jgi:high-affinity iron transporter
MRNSAEAASVSALIGTLGGELLRADQFLATGGSVGFAAFNSFIIIVREGLEAVLLIAALLAYLTAIGAEARHRRQIYAGAGAGILASIGTWFLANTLMPISGATTGRITCAHAWAAPYRADLHWRWRHSRLRLCFVKVSRLCCSTRRSPSTPAWARFCSALFPVHC